MGEPGRPHCESLLLDLSAYLDGELSPAKCRAIERHLAACPCCEDLADQLRRAVLLCRTAGRRRLPGDVRARARARIAELLSRPEAGPARRRPSPGARR
jgi:anti-sigma factor RsiW